MAGTMQRTPETPETPGTRSTRERIMHSAGRLFYAHGIQAVGVDRVVREADVAKMSLYKHFRSKDELVQAWLRERDREWLAWFEGAVVRRAPEAGRGRLLAVFDALGEWFASDDYRGCAFINTACEVSEQESWARQIAIEHTRRVHAAILGWTREAGVPDAEETALHLTLLVEGAIVWAAMHGPGGAAETGRRAAERLLVGR